MTLTYNLVLYMENNAEVNIPILTSHYLHVDDRDIRSTSKDYANKIEMNVYPYPFQLWVISACGKPFLIGGTKH